MSEIQLTFVYGKLNGGSTEVTIRQTVREIGEMMCNIREQLTVTEFNSILEGSNSSDETIIVQDETTKTADKVKADRLYELENLFSLVRFAIKNGDTK